MTALLCLGGLSLTVLAYVRAQPEPLPMECLVDSTDGDGVHILACREAPFAGVVPDSWVPGSPVAHSNLGRALHIRGDLVGAQREYEDAMFIAANRLDFRSRDILVTVQAQLAILMIGAGDWENAERTLRACLSLSPDHPTATLYLSYVLNHQKRWAESITLIEASLVRGHGPGFQLDGQLFFNKGMALCAQGFVQAADAQIEYARANYPDIADVRCEDLNFNEGAF